MKTTNKYYHKKLLKACKNDGCKRIYFFDHIDWKNSNNKAVWTDVFFRSGRSSVFAFTISSSFAPRGFVKGSVPESFKDLVDDTWNLYVHKKWITQEDIGNACKKWIKLLGPTKKLLLINKILFNKKEYGYCFVTKNYPDIKLDTIEEMDEIRYYSGNLQGGIS